MEEYEETDVLGAPYTVETIPLAPDDEGAVDAHLVRLRAPAPTRRAVLHVHGFCDYFFHTEYARWWADRGVDVYAVDLRKYGRSLRPHQTPGYADDLTVYYEELDAVWERITERDGHDQVLISAHSTGGLIAPLWAHHRQPALAGMFLNSPWVDMHGPFWVRLGARAVQQLGGRQPRREIPRTVNDFYARALHRDFEGEWDYDLSWKPAGSWPVYAGWLRAVRLAHRELHRGLDVPAPVLVITSGRTTQPTGMTDEVASTDTVLDVRQMRRWATSVGRHVTVVSVDGAIHDVVLSRPEPRARVYAEIGRWLTAYADRS